MEQLSKRKTRPWGRVFYMGRPAGRTDLKSAQWKKGFTKRVYLVTLSNTLNAEIAQSVEQRTENPRVDGSIPPLGTSPGHPSSTVEQRIRNAQVIGSSPMGGFFISPLLSSACEKIGEVPLNVYDCLSYEIDSHKKNLDFA